MIIYDIVTPTAYTEPGVVAITRIWKDRLTQTLLPGAYLVDTCPILGYVPGCLTKLKKWR